MDLQLTYKGLKLPTETIAGMRLLDLQLTYKGLKLVI